MEKVGQIIPGQKIYMIEIEQSLYCLLVYTMYYHLFCSNVYITNGKWVLIITSRKKTENWTIPNFHY
jgi:hypothetical protein